MYKLKVFSGIQIGLEVDFEANKSLSIGNNLDKPEYVYIAEFINAFHLDLICSATGVKFMQLIGSCVNVQTNEPLLLDINYDLPLYIVINDSVKLALGNKSHELIWSTDNIAINSINNNFEDTLNGVFNINKNKIDKTRPLLVSKAKIIVIRIFSRYKILCILLLIFLFVFSSISIWYHFSTRRLNNTQDIMHSYLNIKGKILSLPIKYSNINITNKGNIIIIAGVVDNVADIKQLKSYFIEYKNYLQYNLITYTEATTQIQNIINKHKFSGLKVHFDNTSASLFLTGVVDNLATLDDLAIEISNQLPLFSNLDFEHVYEASQIKADLQNMIIAKTNNNLDVVEDFKDLQVNISGYLDHNSLIEFNHSLEQFKSKYPLLLINVSISDIATVLPFRIYMVHQGEHSYLVTDSGYQLFVGGTILGVTLDGIYNNQVVLKIESSLIKGLEHKEFTVVLNLNKLNSTLDESKNNTKDLLRDKVLQEEKESLMKDLLQERKKLDEISQFRGKESNIFLEDQITALNDDIKTKEKELDFNFKVAR